MEQIKRITALHRDFVLLTTLVAGFSVLALALLRPGGYLLEWWGYYMPHTGFVRLSDWGYYPYIHYWMEYPPLLSWLPIAAYRFSHLLPVWNHPWLWYNVAMGMLLLPFQVGNLILIYLIALKAYDRHMALRCAVFYSALFVPLLTWLAWFDSFPLFFLLLGLYLLLLRRPILAGLATGVGFMTKMIPILLLPVGWRVFQTRLSKALSYVAVTLVTLLVIALPFLLVRADLFVASFVNMLTRPSWETIWALFDGYYQGGAVTALEQRFDPGTAGQADHASNLPWPAISVAFGLVYLFLYTRRIDWQDTRRIVAFTGLSLNLFMLYSKGYSPQFLVYILPFVVLLLPNLKGVAYALLLSMVNLLDWPVAQLVLPHQHWLFASAVLFRTLLLIALSVEFGLVLYPALGPGKHRRAALSVPLVITCVGLGVVAVGVVSAFFEEQYAQDPYREVMDFLKEEGQVGILLTSESLYDRFAPFLGHSASLRLLKDDDWSRQRLADLATDEDRLWVVDIGAEDERASNAMIERWLSEHDFPLDSRWFDNARLRSFATGRTPPLRPARASFQEVLLTGYGTDDGPVRPGGIVRVSLRWQAIADLDTDYAVFVQMIGPNGLIQGQQDGQPMGGFRPTSSWAVGEEILDQHALVLSPEAPPGVYKLVVGLYDATTGLRLPLLNENGQAQGDWVLLQTMSVSTVTP